MDTEIRFLQALEQDLERVAALQAAGAGGRRGTRGRPRGRGDGGAPRWKQLMAAAAALLAVAWGVGFVAQSGLPSLGGDSEDAAGVAAGPDDTEVEDVSGLPASRDDAGEVPEAAPSPAPGSESFDAAGDPPLVGGRETLGGLQTDLAKIVRNGRMRVEVEDGTFRDARAAVVDIAEDAGGIVLSSKVQGRSGTFTLRVPSATFDATMVELGRLGTVKLEQQTGEDVTEEFVDLAARLRILRARRAVLEDLMTQATTFQQTLLVQRRFDEVELEIERITGRLRFLDDQVERSTIEVEIVEASVPQAQTPEEIENPSLIQAWSRAIQGFLNVLAVTIVGLGYLLPLLIAAGVYFAGREIWRRRGRSD
jgi:hypothetical protein